MKKLTILLLGFGTITYAQNSMDTIAIREITLLNNRLNTPISKENRNVYVINKAELAKLPIKSLTEILQYASGIDLRQRGPFGTQADISMDGGSFEQTLILVNGIKIMDHQTAHNTMNLPIPLEAIDRVEVIRGPAARVYGNNSLTGVINFVTKKPNQSGIFAHVYSGSNFKNNKEESDDLFWNKGIQLGGNLAKENHQHQLYVSHEKGNGYRYNTAFENNKVYYQGNFQFDKEHDIVASVGYIKNGFGANGFYAAPGDKDSKEIVETTLAMLQSNHQLNSKLKLQTKWSYRYNFDDYRYFKHNLNSARSKHYSNAVSGEINSTYQFNLGQFGVGLEYRNEQINSTSIKQHTRNNVGAYAEFKTDLTSHLNMNVGTYLNYNSQYGWQWFPGLDLSYEIIPHLKLIGNIGTSQRIPSFTDLYLDQRPGNIGNENISSEMAYQSEIGIKYRLKQWNFDAYYFYRKINDFIDWVRIDSSEPWQAHNFGNLKTSGFNTRINYLLSFEEFHSLKLSASYAYLNPTIENVDERFASKYKIESLKHQLIQTVEYNKNKTSILVANRYNTRQSYRSYWITDVRVSQKFGKQLQLYVDVQNLFNTSYNEVGSIPLPTRWMSFGVKFIGI